MAHYAFLDENNIVTEVIVGKNEWEDGIDWEAYYGNFKGQVCKRTSYNTIQGTHTSGNTPFRKNYAGIGYSYDANLDAFIPSKPFASWILDTETCTWKAPVDVPEFDSTNQFIRWDEDSQNWIITTIA